MSDKAFEKIYRDAPRELVERLLEFRAAHKPRRLEVGGTQWSYYSSGEGQVSLLLLPGGTGNGEQPFQHITALAEDFRVISLNYPPVQTMAELVEGAAGILDAEGVSSAHVMGGSYGGIVAQCFVRKYPERVRRMVLSHTLVPMPERIKKVRFAKRLISLLPTGLMRALMNKKIRKYLKQFPEGAAFWSAYFKETLSSFTRADIRGGIVRMLDLYENYSFKPEDLAGWPGRILILYSDDDPMVPSEVQEALLALYPSAQTHRFSGTGHIASVLHPEEYISLIRDFLGEA